MLTKLGCLLVAAVFISPLQAQSPLEGLLSLENSNEGFCFVDSGMTPDDLAAFESLDIQQDLFFHQFGNLQELENALSNFFSRLGENSSELSEQLAEKVTRLTGQIMSDSKRETAWVHLRACLPTDQFDIPRWHMDGHYFTQSQPSELMYKFVMALKGPSTLFYPIAQEDRQVAWAHMRDRRFMQNFCQEALIVIPQLGEGALFLGGNMKKAALHSEPPIHENRLFFSIIPCSEKQLKELQVKVKAVYPPSN